MDENILRLIIETGGTGVVILGIVWLFKPVFLKWLDNLAVARKFEAEREQNELEQSRRLETALNGVVAELALSRQVNSQFAARFEALPTRQDFEQVGVTMRDWARKHAGDVDNIPAKVWELSEGPLEELKRELIAAMEVCLNEKVDLKAIQEQLGKLLEGLNTIIEKANEKKEE